jgi:hypothetical protein
MNVSTFIIFQQIIKTGINKIFYFIYKGHKNAILQIFPKKTFDAQNFTIH